MTRLHLLLVCGILAACAPPRPVTTPSPVVRPAQLRQAIDSMLADPRWRTAQLGILVVDPDRGDTLYSHNAGKLFMPASNQKILTGAVALAQLGPEFRFSTEFLATGPLREGVVDGDLQVNGAGDPSVSDRMAGNAMLPLQAVAESLAVRGIVRIAGALVPGPDVFPDAALGFGWSWDDLDFAYSAGVDELFFNEGFMRVTVVGGASPGDPVRVTVAPTSTWPRMVVDARTTAARVAGDPPRRRFRVGHDSTDAMAIRVEGEVPAGDSTTVTLTWRDQRRAYLEALREALELRGIVVDSGVALRAARGLPPDQLLLLRTASPPLREVLAAFEKPSQNQIGEILLKTLGLARTGVGRADSGARVVREQLLAWGARPDGFVIRDGSGLSRHNVVTPETIVQVLDAMRRGPHASIFVESLPIAGVDGTIRTRMRGTSAQANLRAKTGTLDMVRSLSGYVTTPQQRTIIFSVLANNFLVPNRDVEAVQDVIGVMLSRLVR